jgi:hypothetical protein
MDLDIVDDEARRCGTSHHPEVSGLSFKDLD